MKSNKFDNEALWERMGRELHLLRSLASKIHTDRDYQKIMTHEILDRFFKIQWAIDTIRSQAEERMMTKSSISDTRIFYPQDTSDEDTLITYLRQELRDACGKSKHPPF